MYKVRIKLSVIPRLDPPIKSEDGIQCFQWIMDPPVKPEDDRTLLYAQTLVRIIRRMKEGEKRHFLHPS